MKSKQTHSIVRDGKKYTWQVENLWRQAARMTPFDYDISSCPLLDDDCWFGDRYEPTVRNVVAHSKKILAADFKYPIILGEDGVVMDGLHRIGKALLEGRETVLAVKFENNPPADLVEAVGE